MTGYASATAISPIDAAGSLTSGSMMNVQLTSPAPTATINASIRPARSPPGIRSCRSPMIATASARRPPR